MKKVAVIGLGIMGHGIADNFLKNGYEVRAWNRSSQKADDLVKKGAVLSDSVADAVRWADLIFEVTANDESSRGIWLGENGILACANPGQTLITCATLSAEWVDELADLAKSKGLNFFDMPMTGSRIGAESGQLTLMVGGDKTDLDELRDDLRAIAKDVKYFGQAGSGTRYKLVLNMLQAVHIAGLAEALKMAGTAGLDKKLVGLALAERPGGVVTSLALESFETKPIPANFSVQWIKKDLDYAKKMTDINHPLLDEVNRQYQKLVDEGRGEADWTIINEL